MIVCIDRGWFVGLLFKSGLYLSNCMYVCMHACIHVCMYVGMCVCVCVCVCVCMYGIGRVVHNKNLGLLYFEQFMENLDLI